MRSFIQPANHWLYDKIKLQEQLTDCLVALGIANGWTADLLLNLEEKFGKVDYLPLGIIIDRTNPYEWLRTKVTIAENRYAYTVFEFLKFDSETRLEKMATVFKAFGTTKRIATGIDLETAYHIIVSFLLDGMPCDNGCKVIHQNLSEYVWQYNTALHPLCCDKNGSYAFSVLRKAFLDGVVDGTGLTVELVDDSILKLKK